MQPVSTYLLKRYNASKPIVLGLLSWVLYGLGHGCSMLDHTIPNRLSCYYPFGFLYRYCMLSSDSLQADEQVLPAGHQPWWYGPWHKPADSPKDRYPTLDSIQDA